MQKDINIIVDSKYISEQSIPSQLYYLFSYDVCVENKSIEKVQLLSRYWKITDGTGRIEEVHGPGVVGKKPILEPGTSFTYTSFCPLKTPIGFMEGYYLMINKKGIEFNVQIDRFHLIVPETLN